MNHWEEISKSRLMAQWGDAAYYYNHVTNELDAVADGKLENNIGLTCLPPELYEELEGYNYI